MTNPLFFVEEQVLDINVISLLKNNFINYFSFDFPFSTGVEAEKSKNVWFDWYSRLTMRSVKYLEIGNYNLNGAKAYANRFDFTLDDNETITGLDNLLVRTTSARKHYKDNWGWTSFISKMKTPENLLLTENLKVTFSSAIGIEDNNFSILEGLVLSSKIYTDTAVRDNFAASSLLTPTKSFWLLLSRENSYKFYSTLLVDILEKRENLVKRLIRSRDPSSVVFLPNTYKSSTQNPLLIL